MTLESEKKVRSDKSPWKKRRKDGYNDPLNWFNFLQEKPKFGEKFKQVFCGQGDRESPGLSHHVVVSPTLWPNKNERDSIKSVEMRRITGRFSLLSSVM